MADWDDLYAAGVVAASRAEAALLSIKSPGPDETVLEFRTIRDEPVEVAARRLEPPAAAGAPSRIELTCRYGRFGDAHEQARLLEAMTRRLADLRGVDYRKAR